jgi:hypothetical protein
MWFGLSLLIVTKTLTYWPGSGYFGDFMSYSFSSNSLVVLVRNIRLMKKFSDVTKSKPSFAVMEKYMIRSCSKLIESTWYLPNMFKTHLNIILLSTPRLCNMSLASDVFQPISNEFSLSLWQIFAGFFKTLSIHPIRSWAKWIQFRANIKSSLIISLSDD